MTFEYDEKGKIYTNVIHKDPIGAVIRTVDHLIKGQVFVREGERLKDELDQCIKFLPVTKAEITDAGGKILHRVDFMLVNTQHIIWLYPDDEAESNRGGV